MVAKIRCTGAGVAQAFIANHNGFVSAELHDLGVVRKIGKGFAVFANGRDEYHLSWEPGRLLGYWESGLKLKGDEPFEITHSDGALPAEIIFEFTASH